MKPTPESSQVVLQVDGMWCPSCARAVELALARTRGVASAQVSLTTRAAVVQLDPEAAPPKLALVVRSLGYSAKPWPNSASAPPPDESHQRDLAIRLAFSVLLTMWVMLLQLLLYLGELPAEQRRWVAAGAGALATPVVWLGGARLHRAGFRTLRAGAPGMDFLVSLGALAAWGLSSVRLLLGASEVWFDSAAMLVTFLLAGRLIDATMRARGFSQIRSMLERPTQSALRETAEGVRPVPAFTLAPGHVVVVRAGEEVPVDGVVLGGAADLDRSSLTGEAEPEPITPGTRVHAGCTVVQGELRIEVHAGVGARRIDHLRAQIRAAIDQRPELQAVADRFAERLVPLLLVLAGATVVVWTLLGASMPDVVLLGVSVLVITCPCALGLAAPLALVVAVGAAAKRGILLRNADALERAAEIDTVVFDKTGTLTNGRPEVLEVHAYEGAADALVGLAASAEFGVEHPVAGALRRAAHRRGIPPDVGGQRRSVSARGVVWAHEGEAEVRVGKPSWLAPAPWPEGLRPGDVVVTRGGDLQGWLRISDDLRPEAAAEVARLRAAGLALHLWSGDAEARVREVADALGFEDARWAQSPEDKARALRQLQAEGRKVAFVGDGVNDAPALAGAHLGMAVLGASDAALAAAPVAFTDGGIEKVADALLQARRTLRVVRQSLGWAIAYNAVAIPAAMAGYVAPEIAALAMAASSVTVSLNALRLGSPPKPNHRPQLGRRTRLISPLSTPASLTESTASVLPSAPVQRSS